MAFTLKGDRVAVDADPIESKTASGLHIPEGAEDMQEPRYGTVVAVGEGHHSEFTGELVPVGLDVGTQVFFHKRVGETWKFDGTEVLVLGKEQILGVVETELKSV